MHNMQRTQELLVDKVKVIHSATHITYHLRDINGCRKKNGYGSRV